MKTILALAFVFSGSSFASETKTLTLPDFSNLDKPAASSAGRKMKFDAKCTGASGQTNLDSCALQSGKRGNQEKDAVSTSATFDLTGASK